MRAPRRAPFAARVFAVVGLAGTVAGSIAAVAWRVADPVPLGQNSFGFGDLSLVGFCVLGITFAAVGGLLVVRRPFYAGIVVLIGGPLAGVTGGDTISVALSTLAVAALFQPLRLRVQSVVDRRFDRARYDGQRLADAFAGRLRDEVDIAAVAADLDATVRVAVHPTMAGLWARERTP